MFNRLALFPLALMLASSAAAQAAPQSSSPVSISVYDRTRADAWQWYAAPPQANTYGYLESLIRIGVAQRIHKWDWQLEVTQPTILDAPTSSISPVAAQGQLGLGGTYYASGANNSYPVAAFFKQGFARYHFGEHKTLRVGRFELFDGQETAPKNPTIAWLQANRVANRLISNFAFTNAQRSFDGTDAHLGGSTWDITAFAARADQGVFNMNGNPELNVDAQYLAFTKSAAAGHVLVRAFAVGYHDGRTYVTKTDNRPLATRAADHQNIRVGTYGGNLVATAPAGQGNFDFVFWGAVQNGRWGPLNQSSGAAAVEGGYQLTHVASAPWLRGGWWRSTGDNNAADGTHNTFFQVLPTPRVYARDPFYNLMNSTDTFAQLIDKPGRKLTLRSDLRWLQLTSGNDFWYQGGGAYDSKVFGFTGRPGNGHTSFASVFDISGDFQATKNIAINTYYAHSWGKSVIGAIYPANRNEQFGYLELVYRWDKPQRAN